MEVNTQGLDNSSEVVTEPEVNEGVNEVNEGIENTEQTQENQSDNSDTKTQEPELLGKFKSQEELLKAYTELEKLQGNQSAELGELRKKAELADKLQEQIDSKKLEEANKNGFETVKAYENHKEMAKFEANAYRKHINECDFPDEMENLLRELEKNPTKELRDTIKSQFPIETIENVAGEKKLFEGQLEAQEQQALYQQLETSARGYLDEVVPKYTKEFENPAFGQIFGEAFRAFGCDLNTEALVNLLHQYVDYANKANNIKSEINKENSNATDAIAGVANTGGGKGNPVGSNLLDLSDEAAAARLAELI
ncbi:MAG: hypothetical protein II453_12615 [Alphaproteobacteria bacterium]|nr:hypothetical protein [Alphaproteobacteria bacterium]